MRDLTEIQAFEPNEEGHRIGLAAILADPDWEEWSLGIGPSACRVLAKRLLELANEHEAKFGNEVLS
jgi:hypothetical protein